MRFSEIITRYIRNNMLSKLMPKNDFQDIEKERLRKEQELRDKKRHKIAVILGLISIGVGIGGYIIAFVI